MTLFQNRAEAARQLAIALDRWRGRNPVVLAIPRGAVPMGRILADALGGELDIVLTRKISAPGRAEFAIGAVGESGWSIIDDTATLAGASASYITDQIATQRALIIKRRRLYTPGRQPISVAGRLVIVVDDGLATGATMVAALHDTRERGPVELVCASPIASGQAYVRVSAYADSVICLDTPETFFGVGQFYREFPQVSDDEVVTLLAPPEPSRSSY